MRILEHNEVPWNFKTWISNFEAVDLPIGDLARDINKDPDFPRDDFFGDILTHLQDQRASSEAVETFCEVWNYYVVSTAAVSAEEFIKKRP